MLNQSHQFSKFSKKLKKNEMLNQSAVQQEIKEECDVEEESYAEKEVKGKPKDSNAVTKIYTTGKNKSDVIFVAKCDIRVDEEIVWDNGKNYTGVNPCVTSYFKCKNVKK